ncbi:SMI1/KNR4 family protein [Inconstantimicrobium mannanitabidum]|uniref:Uncharacterized protein n=1 Tax=Inconstantimicrobium mannanitabidum TaxID=1604901 RepID=A0ACB5RFB7_9CLOT|nr:SMI1/KNR4 family protein [Clostridium sp. TW13]GKX67654.1 hypothetical protein rsdtw13_29120 [Clostridium sp. TW13]
MINWFKKKNNVINNEMKLDKKRKEYILDLLDKARKADPNFKQFGAQSHKYKLKPTISEKEVSEAEKKYNFRLPEDYFWFITNVGNGGAGPYYGLKPFKVDNIEYLASLGKETLLSPMKSQEEYDNFIEKYEECDDDEYDELESELWQGLLYLGTQGCTLNMNIILSGENKGKIMYGDYDRHRPVFAYGNSFIEWYECWLIETAKGYDMTWYGGKMPGDEKELINKYLTCKDDIKLKIQILFSMMKFEKVSSETLNILYEHYCTTTNEDERLELFKRLVRFNHPKINQIIIDGFDSDEPDKYVDYIVMYQQNNFNFWYKILLDNIEKFSYKCVDSIFWRVFQQCSNVDVNDFLKLLKSNDVNMRAVTLGNLFRFCNTNDYIEEILPMFNDEKIVVNKAIYMTHDSDDKRLIPIYEKILKEYKLENDKEDNFAINYMEKFLERMKLKA